METSLLEIRPSHEVDIHTRAGFCDALLQSGSVSSEFLESGLMDQFAYSDENDSDVARHILIGDKFGGLHHLRTGMEINADVGAASLLVEPRGFTGFSPLEQSAEPARRRGMSESRRQQKIKDSGVYRPELVAINGALKRLQDGENSSQLEGSSMFPDEWSAEDVLAAVVAASQAEVFGEPNLQRGSSVHKATIDGVQIRVIKSIDSGKIMTGYPLHK